MWGLARAPRVKIGPLALGKRPVVVLAVGADTPAVARAVREGADVLEARVDLFRKTDPVSVVRIVRALRRHGVPLIGTVRRRREGGQANLDEARRVALYEAIAPWVDAMDVELHAARACARVAALARRHRRTLIVSSHDFGGTPTAGVLSRWITQARARGADIVKIATLARDENELLRLLELTLVHRDRPLVTIAMGELGAVSRVLFPFLGSMLTYTNVVPRDGQLPLPTLVARLRRCSLESRRSFLVPRPSTSSGLAVSRPRRATVLTKGFTLLEVLLATFTLAIAVAAVIGAFITQITLNDHTRYLSLATQDATRVMEAIRDGNTSSTCTKPTLVPPTGPTSSWDIWLNAQGKSMRDASPAANPIPERIVVTCKDFTGGILGAACGTAGTPPQIGTVEWTAPGTSTAFDPIQVTVAVCWRSRNRVIGECSWNAGAGTWGTVWSPGANNIIDSPAELTTVVTCRNVSP